MIWGNEITPQKTMYIICFIINKKNFVLYILRECEIFFQELEALY